MDLFKEMNVVKATSYDFNAPRYVNMNYRNRMSKMLSRYSRRKLKQELYKEGE